MEETKAEKEARVSAAASSTEPFHSSPPDRTQKVAQRNAETQEVGFEAAPMTLFGPARNCVFLYSLPI